MARKQAGFALAGMINQAAQYANAHRLMYGSLIGDDGVLGPAFVQVLSGLLQLLNGERGDFDGGTLDRQIRTIATNNGIKEIDL